MAFNGEKAKNTTRQMASSIMLCRTEGIIYYMELMNTSTSIIPQPNVIFATSLEAFLCEF